MADNILRFKDILEMDGKGPLEDLRPSYSFNDMHVTQYKPGEDELTNYRAYRRKRISDTQHYGPTGNELGEAYDPSTGKHQKTVTPGYKAKHTTVKDPANPKHHTHVHQIDADTKKEETEVDEALNMSQRLARKRLFKRIQPKIKIGRERAKRRIASKEKLQNRSMKKARELLRKKITKDVPKSELSYARRQEIEKRLETPAMKKRIKAIARKMFPKVRQAELAKKRGGSK